MLPRFRTLAGAAPLFLEPPFVSTNLSLRYLPIAADPERLTRFVNEYLCPGGEVPDEVGRFRPCAPFVLVVVATHPHLASESDGVWLSQHELAFSVPLIRHATCDGEEQASLAFTQPFIFLDDSVGLATGRQVWGWPKALGQFPVWADDWSGNDPATLTRLQMGMPSTVTGPQRVEPILEVVRTPLEPQALLASAAQGWTEAWRAFSAGWAAVGTSGPDAVWSDLRQLTSLGIDSWASMMRFPPVLDSNVATLQQFREVEDPSSVSYQALVRSTMQTQRVRSFQLLGLDRMLLGDPTGGLRVRIADHPTQPIHTKLGLLPERIDPDEAGRRVATFAPLYPMEVVADVRYGMGDVDCWRRSDTGWLRPLATPDSEPAPFPGSGGNARARYDLARGSATQAEPPPFDFGTSYLGVLELPATTRVLQALADEWFDGLERAPKVAVPRGANVTLVVGQSLDDPANMSISFQIPVELTNSKGIVMESFIAPFEFTNRPTEAITGQEVEGRRLALARIRPVDSPQGEPSAWRVDAQIPLMTGDGMRAIYTDVAWISLQAAKNAVVPITDATMEARVRSTIDRSRISLLQLPSTAHRGRAVVQRLVSTPLVATAIHSIAPIRGKIRLPDYPCQSIANVLGLEPTTPDNEIESVAGHWVRLHSSSGRGITLPG
jgi:hypothetical protein